MAVDTELQIDRRFRRPDLYRIRTDQSDIELMKKDCD